ncbi:MAG: hypothetical protein Q8Q85_10895 [Gemmatimonadales bacterium]|nr:hypothetical protein [Gemmatimonadales bacterium]
MGILKNIGIGLALVALLGAMLVGSAMDIGRIDPFAGSAEEGREYCDNTPPSMMNEEELQRCAWLREEDERPVNDPNDLYPVEPTRFFDDGP